MEGDSGAPLEDSELAKLQKVLPIIWDDLSPKAQEVIHKQGVAYIDEEGDTVTSIVNGKDCVFTCYDADGTCKCAIEKAYREGKTDFYKPVSCHLYPIRVTQYRDFKAVNYHRWSVCKAAEILGKKEQLPVYKFLKEPLSVSSARLGIRPWKSVRRNGRSSVRSSFYVVYKYKNPFSLFL